MFCSKQKPLQPPHALPAQGSSLELHSIVPPRSLQRFRARAAHPNFNTLRPIRCSTQRGGHNFPRGSRFESSLYLVTKSAACNFFCVLRSALSIEIPKSNVGNALLPAIRQATRRVKKMRGWYV